MTFPVDKVTHGQHGSWSVFDQAGIESILIICEAIVVICNNTGFAGSLHNTGQQQTYLDQPRGPGTY